MSEKNTKKILILLAGALWNDSRVLKTAQTLSDKYRVVVWAYHGGVPEKVPYTVIPFQNRKDVLNKFLERTWFWLPFHRNTKSAHKNAMDFDLIWVNDLNTLYTGAVLAQQINARLIYDSHEIYIETINQFFPTGTRGFRRWFHQLNCRSMQWLGRRMEAKRGKTADHIFAANDSFRDVLRERYQWTNLSSLYNLPTSFTSLHYNTESEIRSGISDDEILLLYHGIFNAGRGLELLVETMKVLPNKYKLVLIGKGIFKERLSDLIVSLDLESRVRILPMVPEKELIGFIQGADIGINLLEKFNISKWLASPNKLFQYIHAGVPVVCSNSPENLKVMERFDVGRMVENDVESVARGILDLSANLNHYNREKMNAVAREFTWEGPSRHIRDTVGRLLQPENPTVQNTPITEDAAR